VTVVPISATAPEFIENYHCELDLSAEKSLEPYLDNCKRWFKCDLVYVVSIKRMNRFINRETGNGGIPLISNVVLEKVKQMVRSANDL
jgi:uncharacterized protein YifN (PemK superfamily)